MRTDSEAATAIRVATWNIHGGVGNDGNYDAQRVIAVLRELRADVVALQE
ncbi:MAG: endonuclease/exonuclease/phosphatase family protein, partial [Betaproteobacteria bacterium]